MFGVGRAFLSAKTRIISGWRFQNDSSRLVKYKRLLGWCFQETNSNPPCFMRFQEIQAEQTEMAPQGCNRPVGPLPTERYSAGVRQRILHLHSELLVFVARESRPEVFFFPKPMHWSGQPKWCPFSTNRNHRTCPYGQPNKGFLLFAEMNSVYFPLLVLKGIYDYWTYVFFFTEGKWKFLIFF